MRGWLPSRLLALTLLTDAWDESRAGGGMRLAVVRGAAGAGRTELLRRCYEHCAWGQRYWPDTLPGTSVGLTQPLTPDPFRVPDGVAIPHMWLALTGRPGEFAVLDAAAQLGDHLAALREAVLASDTAAKRRLLSALDAALLVGSLVPFAQSLATAINVAGAARAAPGVVRDVGRAFTPARAAIGDALAVNAGRTVNPGQRAQARELVSNEAFSWARVAAVVPFVVAVDDAQELDPATITFLSTLLRHSGRGAMVLTINTDHEPAAGPAGGNQPLADWLSEQARMGPVTVVDLDPVSADELARLAVDQLAGEPVGPLRDVVQACDGAPGRLTTLLADPRVRRAVTHPGAVMPDLGRITDSRVLRRHWEELPASTRETLAKLALCGPRSPGGWRPATVAAADAEEAAGAGWLRAGTLQFRSPALWETAYQQASEQLTDDQEEAVLGELSGRVAAARRDGSWDSFDPAVAEALLEALIRGNGIDAEQDAMADLIRLRRVTGREAAGAGLLDAIHRLVTDGRAGTGLIVATADALHDAGRDRQALDLLQQRLDDMVRDHGEGSAATIAPLSNLAAYWAALAQRRWGQPDGIELYDHAISLCARLLELRLRHLTRQDRRIPDTRVRLADLHTNRDHPSDAAAQLLPAVEEYRRLLGPDHPQTLGSRSQLAGAYLSAGDLGRAIPLYEQTLTDRQRVLGPDHPDTLTSRGNLASAYRSAGDLGRAIPLFEQTLADRVRVLGPDHPDTLGSRNNLAYAYRSAGDLGRAVPLFEQTLADTVRVLGPDHPHTLTSRNNLAYAYYSAGDLGRAVPLHEQTLTDMERVLGPDHPDTLTSRNNLASAYESAGDLGRAIPLHEQTLADSERVLGPDHPDTLTSRGNLASAYESAGDLGRAIPLFEQTLTDRQRVLGPDHPDTLASRNNLAYAYYSAGDLGRAVPLHEQTLTDMERVLGPDHPHTLTSRNNLASAYRSGGDLGRAVPLYEQTLTDTERVLGPDHPNTRTVRANLEAAREKLTRNS